MHLDVLQKEREEKQDQYFEMRKSLGRLNRGYEIDQVNLVFDFIFNTTSNWKAKSTDCLKEEGGSVSN